MERTAHLKAVRTSAWPKRLKSCISLHLESLIRNHTLRLRGRTYRQLTTSPTWVVHSQKWFISILIAKASVTFGRLRENVWERIAIRLSTKLKVYHAVVLTTSSLLMWDLDCVQQTRTRQPAQSYPPELPPQTSPHQMAGQKSWHGGHRKGGHPQRWHPPTESPG